MPTRQQKFACIIRELHKASNGDSREAWDYWRNRLADYVRQNAHRITIASGK